MQQENGKNIYKDFIRNVELAKDTTEESNSIFNNSLVDCIDLIKKSSNIKEVLNHELIMLQNFDINYHNKNEEKINNRINYCSIAIDEYDLFNTDKKRYLNKAYQKNMFSSKEIDINKDSIFEQSVKKLIINLGKEKQANCTSPQLIKLYEVRMDKLKEICKEFTKERKAFMSQHINQENTNKQTKQKDNSKGFER